MQKSCSLFASVLSVLCGKSVLDTQLYILFQNLQSVNLTIYFHPFKHYIPPLEDDLL